MQNFYVKRIPQCQECSLSSFRETEKATERYCPLLHTYYREQFIKKSSCIDNYEKHGGTHEDCRLMLLN